MDPVSRLRDMIKYVEINGTPDSFIVAGPHLTVGDLRAILVRLDVAELCDAPWCWEHACDARVCRCHAD